MWATHVDRTAATCRLLSRSFVWMASYTRPTEARRMWIEQMRSVAALVVGVSYTRPTEAQRIWIEQM